MKQSKYITTSLPYSNGKPHIGHAFEFIIGDALSRYFKFNGYEVFFNLGLDEHGLKIQQAAEKNGLSPQEYVDLNLLGWQKFIEKIGVDSWDNFYRTSSEDHKLMVQKFWTEAFDRKDIYKKKYTGTYCVGCESFKTDRELIDNKCPDHPTTELNEVEEENYFFRLSKYQSQLRDWANKSIDFIEPISKRAEFLNILENIQDISVSRFKSSVSWGVSVPGDEEQMIYIWWDALTNYIFAAGYFSDTPDKFDVLWNNSEVIQICGPDNLKFQSIIFQGLLASDGIKHTDKLLVHGTILDAEGKKMSKSVGNVVDPIDQLNKYGIDAVRYYALKGLRTYSNSSWDEELLVSTYNSDLADDFGNLVTRVTVLARKALDKYENDPNIELEYSYVFDDKWCVDLDLKVDDIKSLWNNYLISEALHETNKLVKSLNKRIGDAEPWKDLRSNWPLVLEVHYALDKINDLYYPVIPDKYYQVKEALVNCEKLIVFPKIEIK